MFIYNYSTIYFIILCSFTVIDFDGTCTIADSDLECKTSAAVCTDNKCQCPVTMYHDTTNDECLLSKSFF